VSNTDHHDQAHDPGHGAARTRAGTVLEMKGLHAATEKATVEKTLGRLHRVQQVDAHPVPQTATVPYDPATTSVAELRRRIENCGDGCDDRSVPEHV